MTVLTFYKFGVWQFFCQSSVPEDLFELFHLVVWIFLGTAVIKEGSGICKRPCVHLKTPQVQRFTVFLLSNVTELACLFGFSTLPEH